MPFQGTDWPGDGQKTQFLLAIRVNGMMTCFGQCMCIRKRISFSCIIPVCSGLIKESIQESAWRNPKTWYIGIKCKDQVYLSKSGEDSMNVLMIIPGGG